MSTIIHAVRFGDGHVKFKHMIAMLELIGATVVLIGVARAKHNGGLGHGLRYDDGRFRRLSAV